MVTPEDKKSQEVIALRRWLTKAMMGLFIIVVCVILIGTYWLGGNPGILKTTVNATAGLVGVNILMVFGKKGRTAEVLMELFRRFSPDADKGK